MFYYFVFINYLTFRSNNFVFFIYVKIKLTVLLLKKTRTNEWIELPRAYFKQSLPVEKEEIATPNKIKKCDYLKSISREITQQDDIEIGKLFGTNCRNALEPLEIISSGNDGPCAYRTQLGWCIVELIVNESSNKSLKYNHIAVKDVISRKFPLNIPRLIID